MSNTFKFTRVEVSKKGIDLSSIGIKTNDKLHSATSLALFHANQITKALGYRSAFSADTIEGSLNILFTILLDNNIITEADLPDNYSAFDVSIYERQRDNYLAFIADNK